MQITKKIFLENIDLFSKISSDVSLFKLQSQEETHLTLTNKLEGNFNIFYKTVINELDDIFNDQPCKTDVNLEDLESCVKITSDLISAGNNSNFLSIIKNNFKELHNFIETLKDGDLDMDFSIEEIEEIRNIISATKYDLYY